MTPLCVLHHQLCVTCCSLGPNVLNITHFDLSVYISKLICCPCDDNLTLLHEADTRLRGAGGPPRCEALVCSAPRGCTMLLIIYVFNQDKSRGGWVTARIISNSSSSPCDKTLRSNQIKAKNISEFSLNHITMRVKQFSTMKNNNNIGLPFPPLSFSFELLSNTLQCKEVRTWSGV